MIVNAATGSAGTGGKRDPEGTTTDGGGAPRRVALITGAGNGIGAATAKVFADQGYRLVMTDLKKESLDETRADIGLEPGQVSVVAADVTQEGDVARVVQHAVDSFGRLDALINVVGGSRPGKTVTDLDLAEWNFWLSLNLTSVFLMCREAMPHLIESGGTVVNVASGAGLRGMRANPAYCAAKAGVVSLTRALAIDHGGSGVRVNCVSPGPVRTPLMERNRSAEEIAAIGRLSLLGRVGDPQELGDTIAWLAGDGASYINGQTIEVDGGPAPLI